MPVATSPEAFVADRRAALVRSACSMTGHLDDAEDLVQTALLKSLPHWSRIAGEPAGYLHRIMVNEQVSRWRRHRGREVLRADVPDRLVLDADLADRVTVRRALDSLPPRQHAVVVLRYYEDLTESETARVLGISVGTVKSQHRKALDRLRRLVPAGDDGRTGR